MLHYDEKSSIRNSTHATWWCRIGPEDPPPPATSRGTTREVRVADDHVADARSIGALHGSARGNRNIDGRLGAMARLGALTGDRLLDIGCGTGEYTRRLASGFERVDAIDIEHERLRVFAESEPPGNVAIEAMSVNALEYEDESFDTVTMIEVLEHLTERKWGHARERMDIRQARLIKVFLSRKWIARLLEGIE